VAAHPSTPPPGADERGVSPADRAAPSRDHLAHPASGGAPEAVALRLTADAERLTVGRGPSVDLDLEGDPEVSRLHAELLRIGEQWVLSDDGLSRNGTWVDDERVSGRRRLRDGDLVRFGSSTFVARLPTADESGETRVAADVRTPTLTPTQRAVLVALARPYADGDAFARPATNREVAETVHLSVDAVKGHLRTLAAKLGLGDLPQNEKRLRLVEESFRIGAITRAELRDG
jgi:hypothetical protein